jgi:ribosome maturation factor RimP
MSPSETQDDHDLPHHEGLEARIAEAILPSLGQMGYELVRVQVSGKERPVVQVMADRADGAAFRVEDCEAISHTIGAVLDVADPIRGEWMLEVSSAGIDRPLTRTKDWNRYAGHLAQLELAVPAEGRKRFKGVVLGADASEARLRTEDGAEHAFPRGNIRRAKLVLTDELIAATAAQATSVAATAAQATSVAATAAQATSSDTQGAEGAESGSGGQQGKKGH